MTISAILVTVALNVVSSALHLRLEKFYERWRAAAIDPKTGLPRNHDLQHASLESLRGAAQVLILELVGRIEPDKPWIKRAADRLNRAAQRLPGGGWLTADLFPGNKDPHRRWLDLLRAAVHSKDFEHFHNKLRLSDDQVRQCFKEGELCEALGAGLADKLLEWARCQVKDGKDVEEHGDFETLVRKGWDIQNQEAAAARRVTLAHAYCLFFREHLKSNPKVFHIFTADALNEMHTQLGQLGGALTDELKDLRDEVAKLVQNPPAFATFEAWLTPQLGAINNLLADVKDNLDRLAQGQQELKQQQGEILVAITALRVEVTRGNPAAQPALDQITGLITSLGGKLDYLIGGLPITRFQLADPPTRELDLLQAKHRTVTLLGRDTDLDALCSWVESKESISARLLVGGAGTGKTRLALELLLRVAAALPGWQAGLLGSSDLRRLVKRTHTRDFNWPAPTLLVVDYAQPLAAPLAELLRALTHRRDAGLPSLRLLLLERQPGDWFKDLLRQEDSTGPCAVRALFHPPAPVKLTPLPPGELRRRVLAQTLEKAALLNGKSPPALPEGDPEFDASLARPLFDQPLNLMLAALAASDLELLPALQRPKDELVFFIAKREERRLLHSLPEKQHDLEGPGFLHLAACATICHGLEHSEFLSVASNEAKTLGYGYSTNTDSVSQPSHRNWRKKWLEA